MLRVLSLFSGIGAFEKALSNVYGDYQLVNFSEIDNYATKAYSLIHNVSEDLNLGDITKIDVNTLPKDIDILTHGSPCQSFSISGNQAGGDEGSGTKSSLMWYSVNIIKHIKPKVVVWENVKNVLSPKHKHNFDKYINTLNDIGYNSYYQVLDAKDFGVPQHRERIFVVSIRKDIDSCQFEFPKPLNIATKLRDVLEDTVDKKYYLSDKVQKRFKVTDNTFTKSVIGTTQPDFRTIGQRDLVYQCDGIMGTLTATDYKQPKQILGMNIRQIGNCCPTKTRDNPDQGRVYDKDGLSPTLNTMQGGNRQPMVIDDICEQHLIRKLTPRECYRLMGFNDEDFNKVNGILSDTQLYKTAGNSIVVNVLENIFKQLIKAQPNIFD